MYCPPPYPHHVNVTVRLLSSSMFSLSSPLLVLFPKTLLIISIRHTVHIVFSWCHAVWHVTATNTLVSRTTCVIVFLALTPSSLTTCFAGAPLLY